MLYYSQKDNQGNNRVVLNQNGVVKQINHYYPYGSLMGEGYNASSQPYRYGGKELVTLGGLSLSDFDARWLDSPSGSFTTMDPLCENFYATSPYIYCAANPIKYIDPTGAYFGTVAEYYANWLITIGSEMLTNHYNGRAPLSKNDLSEITNMIFELEKLENSGQKYEVVIDPTLKEEGMNTGMTYFQEGTVYMAFSSANDDISIVVHEFKHGAQFENGEISLTSKNGGRGRLFYDKTDEVSAYKRGAVFGGNAYTIETLPNSLYGTLPTENNSVNTISPFKNFSKLKSLSIEHENVIKRIMYKYNNQAIRFKGKTYY